VFNVVNFGAETRDPYHLRRGFPQEAGASIPDGFDDRTDFVPERNHSDLPEMPIAAAANENKNPTDICWCLRLLVAESL